ncbi:hypothetical protein RSOLAG1IB_00544 [Rhizoctonia solani AG-1 IB]|uniref:Uncharacterized protein n=1 Tax=Thanatephorus cucumeris (strain AG1-IB / isolate 7/3/14) TaxID=1108050 RepID=A0A0B7F709_THACB|nr:hypothetical protein RSOLAG1IB_00544 [Rhizoctonia solani AG-1 IB]
MGIWVSESNIYGRRCRQIPNVSTPFAVIIEVIYSSWATRGYCEGVTVWLSTSTTNPILSIPGSTWNNFGLILRVDVSHGNYRLWHVSRTVEDVGKSHIFEVKKPLPEPSGGRAEY